MLLLRDEICAFLNRWRERDTDTSKHSDALKFWTSLLLLVNTAGTEC